jgi:hypothetical protein
MVDLLPKKGKAPELKKKKKEILHPKFSYIGYVHTNIMTQVTISDVLIYT